MKSILVLLAFFFLNYNATSQNLVLNPGFENFRIGTHAEYCNSWGEEGAFFCFRENAEKSLTIPPIGYPDMDSYEGDGCAVIYMYGWRVGYGFIRGTLSKNLQPGAKYEISFYYRFAQKESFFYARKMEFVMGYGPLLGEHEMERFSSIVSFDLVNDTMWHQAKGFFYAPDIKPIGRFFQTTQDGKTLELVLDTTINDNNRFCLGIFNYSLDLSEKISIYSNMQHIANHHMDLYAKKKNYKTKVDSRFRDFYYSDTSLIVPNPFYQNSETYIQGGLVSYFIDNVCIKRIE